MLDRGPERLRDAAVATNFGTQFAFWLSIGYKFGCVIANGTIFDSRGWVFGIKLADEVIADFEVLRDVAMATIFGFLHCVPKKVDHQTHGGNFVKS